MARLQGKSAKKAHKQKKARPVQVAVEPPKSRLEKLVQVAVRKDKGKEKAWLAQLERHYVRRKSFDHRGERFERWEPWIATCARAHEMTLYHGTNIINFATILLKGFQCGSDYCLFGSGIYLADLQKAFGYTRGCEELGWGVIFKCAVNLGRMHEAETPLRGCPEGFDSVFGKAGKTLTRKHTLNPLGILQRDEYCVYDPRRIRILEVWIRKTGPKANP